MLGVLVHGLFYRDDCTAKHRRGQHHLHFVRGSGTLSPMQPLIAEFQIPVGNVLENMHVISDSQVGVARRCHG